MVDYDLSIKGAERVVDIVVTKLGYTEQGCTLMSLGLHVAASRAEKNPIIDLRFAQQSIVLAYICDRLIIVVITHRRLFADAFAEAGPCGIDRHSISGCPWW